VRKQKYLESGQKYSAQGKDKEAVIQYFNALKIDKNFAEAHYALAQSYLHMGAFSAAFSELRQTVNLQPANYKAKIDMGNMLLAGGKTDDAKAQADAVLAAQPDNADAHALLSRVAARRGNKELAFEEIRKALELSPNEAKLHETIALLEVGDVAQGASVEDELKKAVALDPKSVNAKLLLAGFYAKNSRWPEAEQTCKNAIATDPKTLSARISLAQIYLKQGDQTKAEEALRQASNDLPDSPQGVRMLADYYANSGQIDKARAEFASLAKKYPKNLSVQEGYVRILLQVRDYATAQTVISELMKKNSKDPQVAVLNGIVLLNNGKLGDAINALHDAANNAPKDPYIQLWLGKAALVKGDNGLAEKSFRAAAQLDPRYLEAQEELALIAIQRQDMSLLSDVAETTISIAPRFPDGYLWRASAEFSHHTTTDTDKAEADLKTAITNAPRDSRAYFMLGQIRFSQKRYVEGAAQMEAALQYDPNSIGALNDLVQYDFYIRKQPAQALARINAQIAKSPRNNRFYDLLAWTQIQNKNLDQAAAANQKAMDIDPDDVEAISIYSQLQAQRGQLANSIAAWEKWSQAHPSNAGGFAILGMLEESRGNGSKAEDYYKKALAIDPTQALAANNLAYRMLMNGGNVDVALSLAQTARRKTPDSPNSADTLAWAYYSKGSYGFARDLLEEAIKAAPNNATTQYHLGMVYAKQGDKSNATTHLKKAISLAPDSQSAKDAQAALQGLG
jgi:Tfp pilus assembly protein PilF